MMNPLLKHPILQKLPYELMVYPDLEGIKIFLESQKKKTKTSRIMIVGFFIVFGFINLIIYKIAEVPSIYNLAVGIIFLVLVPLPFFLAKHEAKKFVILDDEILEEIRKHEE